MTQPAFFLFSPSQKDARRLGLGGWYDWFRSQEDVRSVDHTREVGEGVFVSFTPICEEEDTFAELEGRAQRWLALDSEGNVSRSTLLAKKCGVDRLLHATLIDEMSSPVIPSALLFLLERGVWLPNTIVETPNLSLPSLEAKANPEAKQILFLVEDKFLEMRRMPLLLKMLEQDLDPFGYQVEVANVWEFGSGKQTEHPSHIVLLSDRPEVVLEVSRWAKVYSIGFAVWEDIEKSPLRLIFAGGVYPETIGLTEIKLRPFFRELRRFLEIAVSSKQEPSNPNPNWGNFRSTSDFDFALPSSTPLNSPFRPPVFATALSSSSGDQFVKWVTGRMGHRSCFEYTPLYYSCEFFRQYDPFDILCDDTLKARCLGGLIRLREILEAGYQASMGYGAMYVLHLGWCSILLGECHKVMEYFESAREPKFSALSGYASELALALWYMAETREGVMCIQYCIRLEKGKVEWPTLFSLARSLVEGDHALDEPVFKEESIELIWIDLILRALVLGGAEPEAWGLANEQEPERTQKFLARSKESNSD